MEDMKPSFRLTAGGEFSTLFIGTWDGGGSQGPF